MKKLPIEKIEIQNLEMQAFLKNWEVWLNKRYRLSTIRASIGTASYYIKWCEAENIDPFKTTYPELLSFVQAEKAAGKNKRTIKQKLVAIKHFYNYLIETKQRDENPASELLIRNENRKLPPNILKYEVLEKLYHDFPARGIIGKRNKAILGLLIYQGINTGELQALEVKDVKTAEGKIYIPAVNRSNDRTLKLEAHQIVPLQNYIIQIRPVIMAINDHSSDKLFFSSGSSNQLGNSFTRMLKIMRSVFPDIKNLQQIRASMIAHWYTIHNTRQVQYMAGHRYVSSTERYRRDKLESLQEQLEKLHPIQ